MQIEAELSLLIARTVIRPVLIRELRELNAVAEESPGIARMRDSMIRGIENMVRKADALEKLIREKRFEKYMEAMADLRGVVDSLEKIAADDTWPLPKYREMLFLY